jgi:AGCS family alanine or glycine:cation symporter
MEQLQAVLGRISGFVWGPPMLFLLVGTGIFLTFRLRGLQLRKLPYALKTTFSRPPHGRRVGEITRFQALMTALSATIGTGNIIGVATAIALGGPGALFWMWVTAFFGMATKYSEAILAVKYRVVNEDGTVSGGPMYYLSEGLNKKWLGMLFALFGSIAAFGIGNMVQANALSLNIHETFGVPQIRVGVVVAALTAAVILGGIKRIGHVAAWIVPIMAGVYVAGCLVILVKFADAIPGALASVFATAFRPAAASGGFAGAAVSLAVRMGVARGIFSNESGLGSAPIAAAAAQVRHPAEQAIVSMTGTFIDTIVICSMTGLVLLVTGVWNQDLAAGAMTQKAFEAGLGPAGKYIVTFGIVFFAYSTILGWSYYGEKCVQYLTKHNAIRTYRWLWVAAIVLGSAVKLDVVFSFADIANGLMAVPNLIGLLGLSGVVVSETRHFFDSLLSSDS